ncbi:VPS10 domain containing receptor SorCS2 [Dissostichus eleginoides]|uniref:VPS10 domain containing receptor SorCS2 n=1 Tax=Dissostichus eleginoides TaxID=100907 RepID=A0AAD9F2J5_DISEL|nr:VPS10 domain containing receptor SorCS2 [Dissostichus eleginoides]
MACCWQLPLGRIPQVILILTKYYHADSTKVLESSLWSKPLPFNSEVSVGLGYLSAALPQGDKIDIERYGGQNISRQLGVKWGTGE